MKVDYEELMQYYEAARYKHPGEWKDAIEAILDAVPDIVKEHDALEEDKKNLEGQRQTAFEDGFVLGAKLVDVMLDAAFDMFGGDNLGLPKVTFVDEIEAGKTDCWNLYMDGGKEAVLAQFNKRLAMLK